MAAIASATLTAFYLFDVADQIDVTALQSVIGGGAAAARLLPKSSVPSYFQYSTSPVVADGDALGIGDIDGFRTRLKFFDYGVVSVALSRPFTGEWSDLIGLSQKYIEDETLEQRAEAVCREICERFAQAITSARATYLSEDYLVFAVTGLERPIAAEALVLTHGAEIALLLRGERHALSEQEQGDVLRNRLSYLADDLVIPTWNAALVYDTEPGAQALLEIFEFANSQLLEFRYYDQLLDVQLGRIYAQLQHQRWFDNAGRPPLHTGGPRASRVVHRRERAQRQDPELLEAGRRHLRGVGSSTWPPPASGSTAGKRASRRSSKRSTTSIALRSNRSARRGAISSN